ncbi:glycosyltransferase family 4 protein [Agrobacterium sp. a22-2]|uniref:glycosyltransferase family 4 protein n=1 Tax=Agrobacterium sp. a22-2 TaxID=2283840 RepID=UPI0014476ED2|nr:glycosyltransferase family 4 protein [Agrobacterium sp. a22-2]NKN35687.1 glycosyltransferase family 4 protein [Agrobacterium sp. a22-2]
MSESEGYQVFSVLDANEINTFKKVAILVFRAADLERNARQASDFLREKQAMTGLRLIVIVLGHVTAALDGMVELPAATLADYDVPTELLVYQGDGKKPDEGLPTGLLFSIIECDLRSVSQFNFEGDVWPYQRAKKEGKTILFLFPGSIFPVSMGSHRRAIGMLAALVDHGLDVTVMFTGPTYAKRLVAAQALSLFAVDSTNFSNGQDKWRRIVLEIKKSIARLMVKLSSQKTPVAESFVDRAFIRNSGALRRCIERLGLERFDGIYVNYAWMLPAVLAAKPKGKLLVCDTHDVQFFRALSLVEHGGGSAQSLSLDSSKKEELRLLGASDFVLAISERDAALLKSELPPEKVLVGPSSYRYCYMGVRRRPELRPFTFGFLGHNMPANVIALEHVLKEWWPTVSRLSPASKFIVAGSVCSAPSIRKLAFLNDTVELAGFVKTLAGYFGKIDVLLSPVFVAGGMNFKNAEAIVAGVSLITNRQGAETLGDVGDLHVADNEQELVECLRSIELNADEEYDRRNASQKKLMQTFAPDHAVQAIIRGLGS